MAPLIALVFTVTLANKPVLMWGNTMRGETNVGSQKWTLGLTVAQIRIIADGAMVTLVMIRTGSRVATSSVAEAGVIKTASKR